MNESLVSLEDDQVEVGLDKYRKRVKELEDEAKEALVTFSQTGVDLDRVDEIEGKLKEMKRALAEIKESLSKELENDKKELKKIMEEYDAEEDRVISFVTQNPLQYMFSLVTGKTRNRRR